MSFMFDLRSLGSAAAVPFKFILGGTAKSESAPRRSARPSLVQHWEKSGDGRLKAKWERDSGK